MQGPCHVLPSHADKTNSVQGRLSQQPQRAWQAPSSPPRCSCTWCCQWAPGQEANQKILKSKTDIFQLNFLQHLPTLFEIQIQAKITHLIREVPLEFCDSLEPICTSLFWDKLNIEEGTLPWTIQVAWGGPSNYTWRYVCHYVLENKRSIIHWHKTWMTGKWSWIAKAAKKRCLVLDLIIPNHSRSL